MKNIQWTRFLVLLLFSFAHVSAVRAQVSTEPDTLLQRAAKRVSAGDLVEAERLYAEALAVQPDSNEARLGLARVLMWQLRIAEAERYFLRILETSPNDLDAREGIATIAYWRGNLATAFREMQRVLRADPTRANARSILSEIDRAFEPRYRADVMFLDDDQPYERSTSRLAGAFRPRPALGIDAAVKFEQFETASRSDQGFAIAVSAERYLRPLESRLSATVEPMRFPNGDTAILGNLALVRRLIRSESTLALRLARDDILVTSAAVERKATVTVGEMLWQLERRNGWLGGAQVSAQRYFDDNDGLGASAYLLAPMTRRSRSRLWGGISLAYRDTEESRFGLSQFRSVPQPTGGFRYLYEGVYDPYWTPHDLREGRIVLAAEHEWKAWKGKIHVDGGIARDDAVGFGPAFGSSPVPAIGTSQFAREFHPWRVAVSIIGKLGPMQAELGYERSSTVFYEANEYRASVAGRF